MNKHSGMDFHLTPSPGYDMETITSRRSHPLSFSWLRVRMTALVACLACLWFLTAPAYALDPDKRVTQYMHTSWRIQDGSAPDGMFSITQTSDGFLWLTSASKGMYRFDGVRLLPWTFAVDGKTIDHVVTFHADLAGGLWARGKHEIFYLKGGAVTARFPLEAPDARAGNVSADPDRSLWVLRLGYEMREPLCDVTGQGVKCFGPSDGLLLVPYGGEALLADGKGGFWLGGMRAVVHWREGASEVYPIDALKSNIGDGVAALALDPEGSLWVGLFAPGPGMGLGRLERGIFKSFVVPGFDGSKLSVFAMTVDREGSLWVGTAGDGLFRIRGTSVERYGRTEGLSGDDVKGIYEDREGNLWVTTTNGIDRFREAAVTTFSKLEGLGMDLAMGVLADRDGSVWVANVESLDRIDKNGAVSSIRWGKGLPGDQVYAMLEDRAGNLWMGVGDGLYIFKNGRFRRIPEPDHEPLGLVTSMTEDIDGNIWAVCSGKSRKLVRIRDFQIREEFSTSQIPMGRLAPDPHGGIWIGPGASGEVSLVLFRDGVQTSFPTGSAVNLRTNHLAVQADGSVLAGFDDGLVGLRQGQVQRMTTKNGLPCNPVYSFIEDKAKRWWLLTECGIVELPDSELQRWWADPEAVLQTRLYDALDGARPVSFFGNNPAALSTEGRVWFATGSLVQSVGPSRLSQKELPPVTYIESVTANRNVFAVSENLKLPEHLSDLQIDYTSPTVTTPQKVKFRYRLEPYDDDWHDAGTRRQAFYTDLPPGSYTFQVMASNKDGVWNESAAKLDFSVDAAFYQTTWFRLACIALILVLLWAGYKLRVRQLRREEKKLRAVIEGMPVMAFSMHPDGSPELVNQRWLDYAGLPVDAPEGGRGWESSVHPDDVEVHRNKARAALKTGEPFENEARHRSASGEYRWFLVRAVPFRDKQGKIVKWYGTLTDIEERKRADEERERLRQLESELAHINRVSMLGELTASLAHEIRQPIAAAVTNANACMRWLTREPPDLEEARAAVNRIGRDGNRAADIITRLKSFYKKGVPTQREPVDVNEVVGEMLVLLHSEASRHSVVMRTELESDLPAVRADRVQLQQVLMNLMLNGIEAMKQAGGELQVKTRREGGEVLVSVSDTGEGIPADKVEQIFNAFFTTKVGGTGMGLAISRTIIGSHGGRLWAKANVGRGATFHLTLPSESAAGRRPAASLTKADDLS